jgi:DNA-binding NarL/FixJ family response regulator
MGDRPRDDDAEWTPAAPAPTTWLVSPHLLVAQAVSAALRSAGIPAATGSWDAPLPPRLPPDESAGPRHVVVLLDGLATAEVMEQILALNRDGGVRVVVVAAGAPAVWWGGLLASDDIEIVSMTTSLSQLAGVVARFTRGESVMDPIERRDLRRAWSEALALRRDQMERLSTLSPQQRRVLELLASGRRVAEVAEIIGLTSATVRSHVKALRAKLGVKTQLEAVAMLNQVYDLGRRADLVPRPRQAPADDPEPVRRR